MSYFFIGMEIFIAIILYITGMYMQSQTSKGVFFGVRTPEKFFQREDFKVLKKEYKRKWTITCFIATVVAIALSIFMEATMVIGVFLVYTFGLILLVNLCYYNIHKKVKVIKAKEDWSEYFTKENIVIVDLKKEKQEKDYNKLFIIPIIMVGISIIVNIILYKNGADGIVLHRNAQGIADRIGQKGNFDTIFETVILMPLILSGFTAFFWAMNKVIYKAKNQINGGNANEIIEQKRFFRKVCSWIFIISNIDVIIIMEGINIMEFSNKEPGVSFFLFNILGTLIPIIILIFFAYKIGQGGSKVKIKGKIEGDKIIINRDDDDNYVLGSLYYNKHDTALFVEKRIGFGWTLNFGNKKAKWFFAPVVGMVIFVMILLLVIVPNSVKPRDINITNSSITINGSYGETINRENIETVSLEKMPKILSRNNGASIDDKHYGNYKIEYKNEKVKAKLYVENEKLNTIIIQTKDGKIYLINRSVEEVTKEIYDKIR